MVIITCPAGQAHKLLGAHNTMNPSSTFTYIHDLELIKDPDSARAFLQSLEAFLAGYVTFGMCFYFKHRGIWSDWRCCAWFLQAVQTWSPEWVPSYSFHKVRMRSPEAAEAQEVSVHRQQHYIRHLWYSTHGTIVRELQWYSSHSTKVHAPAVPPALLTSQWCHS